MLETLTVGFKSGLVRLKEHSCQNPLYSLGSNPNFSSCLASDLQYIITLTSLSPKIFASKNGNAYYTDLKGCKDELREPCEIALTLQMYHNILFLHKFTRVVMFIALFNY